VFEFSTCQALCVWGCTAQTLKQKVETRVLAILKSKACQMTTQQRNTLDHLIHPVHPMHLQAILHRRCVCCHKDWKGRINEEWGVHAHRSCINSQLTNVNSHRGRLPIQHMRSLLPIEVRDDFSMYGLPWHTYDMFWRNIHCAVPRQWTVEWYEKTFPDKIQEYQAQREQQRKRRRSAENRIEADLTQDAIQRLGVRKCRSCCKKNALHCTTACCGDCCTSQLCPRHGVLHLL
jgi:hypothetical protein